MVIKTFVAGFLIVAASLLAFGQESSTSPLGFSMQTPKNWRVTDKGQLSGSVEKLDLSDEALAKLLRSKNNSVVVMAFIKYDPASRDGVIPTIQVRMRDNPMPDFPTFMSGYIKSLGPIKSSLPNFEFIEAPKEVSVSGARAVMASSTYTLQTQDGQTLHVRSRVYAIPYGKRYFHVTFMDDPKSEDCSKEFDALAASIKIGRQ